MCLHVELPTTAIQLDSKGRPVDNSLPTVRAEEQRVNLIIINLDDPEGTELLRQILHNITQTPLSS